MIPQRVSIEGFLSYRHPVVLEFDGAKVWMLTGENGSGKSSVFDAIVFALYGVHRGGKSNVEELINRRSDRLAVEFDFLLGPDRYRVRRTVAHKGGPTYQATHLSGPNSPVPTAPGANRQPGPQPVPGTNTRSGLTAWVERRLGLKCEAFKMSALLEQGKSDALLSAEPKDRHQLLSQLVDLRRYEALAQRAKEGQRAASMIVDRNRMELAALPPVTEAELETQQAYIEAAKSLADRSQTRLEQLQGWMAHAATWINLLRRRDQTRQQAQEMAALLADAESIEQAAARLQQLQTNLPRLKRVLHHGEEQAMYLRQAQEHRLQADSYAALVNDLAPQIEVACSRVEHLQGERESSRRAETQALQQLNELAAPLFQIEEMARLNQEMAQCDELLARFAPDLDQECNQAQRSLDEIHHITAVLPYLERYVAAREQWHAATTQLEAAQQEQASRGAQVSAAAKQIEQAQIAVDAARVEMNDLQAQRAVAQHALDSIQEQVSRFETVGSEPTCPYCGQPLSSEHLASERVRLDLALAAAAAASSQVFGAHVAAQLTLDDAESHLAACRAAHARGQKEFADAESRCRRLTDAACRAETDGALALANSREHKTPLALLPQADAITACFAEAVPDVDELAALTQRVRGKNVLQSTLVALRGRVSERDRIHTSRGQFELQFTPLVARYPAQRVQELQASRAAAEQAKSNAQRAMASVVSQLSEATGRVHELDLQGKAAQNALQRAQQDALTADQLARAAQVNCEQEIGALDDAWAALARQVDASQLAAWQDEIISLAGAAARQEALAAARSQIALVETRLAEINRDMEAIPVEARQPLELLQQEEAQARNDQRAAQSDYQEAVGELRVMKERRQRIIDLAAESRAADKRSHHYGQLAKFLGRDYLQRFLLQQAERSIVARANEVLDRCSGGMLSMELRPNNEDGALQKAFELMVENRATQTPQDKLMPAWLLSGSQRFRVAISLALGIGEYASAHGQGIESVIIDEGFGSLDRQGLRDMEDALRFLSGTLGRIILVSHQDEFASVFPHRYRIALEDGASIADLVDGAELL